MCRVPEEAPQEVEELLDHCTHEEPASRPTMLEVLQRLEALVPPGESCYAGTVEI